jgi:ketosteroid isomerase-like protein
MGWILGLSHMTGRKTDGNDVDLWYRTTACLRRTSDGWRIAHLHNSVPFAMDGSGRALLDLRPM